MNDQTPIKAPLPVGGQPLAIVPRDFEQVWRMANMLSSTSMVPRDFKGKPEETAAAIMYGLEVGLSPVSALQSIAVINGRPSLWGDALPALMRKNGHKLHEVVDGDGDTLKATVTLIRADGERIVRSFSWKDAKKAGLSGKTGPWQQYPQRMCQMRARAWAIRDGAAEVLRGLAIAEEMQDVQNIRDVTPKPSVTLASTPLEVPFDEEPGAAPAEQGPESDEMFDERQALHFISQLEQERGWCESEQDVLDLRDSREDMLPRLPPKHRAEAERILEIE